MAESRDTWKTLDLALRIGEILLSSGAGAADVTATMLSVTHACGLRGVTADVTFTQLALHHQPSVEDPGTEQVRRVTHRETDFEDLTMVDQLVGDLIGRKVDRDGARSRLAHIVSSGHRRPRWAVTVGWGAMGAGTALLLGGGPLVTGIAFVAAALIDRVQRRMSRNRLPFFYQQVVGGLVATTIAVGAAAAELPVAPSLVVSTGIIMLLAGIGFVGATQDALTGFPVTAGARILEAVLATAGIIAGVSGGLTIGRLLGVDLGRLQPGATALSQVSQVSVMTMGAALASAAFAFASYAPLRALAPAALLAADGQLVAMLSSGADIGSAWATALAAVTIGILTYSVSGRVRVPPLVLLVPSVVPLLPGLAIYRGLALLDEGERGVLHLVGAAATAIAIASGVILGQYLAQPLKREARKLETRLAGPRLVGPLRARAVRR